MKTCTKCQDKFEPLKFKAWQLVDDFCYSCSLWPKWVYRKDELGVVRCKGVHYSILGDFEYNYHVYQNDVLVAYFFDGRVVASRNVVCQGAIPDRWRTELPNNAYRVERISYEIASDFVGSPNLVFDSPNEAVLVAPKTVQEPVHRTQLDLFSG